jgi:transposase
VGRSGLDPAVLVKLALVLSWRGLPSMRATLRVAGTDVSIRRFLGFGLTERLPDHSTFSHAQTKRFADSSVFEQLFTAVLRRCTEAGLVGGRRLLVDATHVEADAALKSLRAELSVVERETGDGDGDGHGDGWLAGVAGATVVRADDGAVVVELADGADEQALLDAARRAGRVRRFAPEEPTLADLFREAIA